MQHPSQRVLLTQKMIMLSHHNKVLTDYNYKYGKAVKLSDAIKRAITHYDDQGDGDTGSEQQTLKTLEDTEQVLQERITQMNAYFSDMNKKRLVKVYNDFGMMITQDTVSDIVEYSYGESKYKPKKCTLKANFFIVSSVSGQLQDIEYLTKPSVVEESDNVLVIDKVSVC